MTSAAERLCRLLGIDLPIIQAPMAGVQGSALAIAVSEAGALGSLPCAMLGAGEIARELAHIGARTSRPCNLNFFCHAGVATDPAIEARWRDSLAPYYTELRIDPAAVPPAAPRRPFDETAAALVERYAPRVVSFHFGLPAPALVARLKDRGTRLLSSATTLEEALWLERHGADVIIAQGLEAGGHRGMFLGSELDSQSGTLALLRAIVRAVRVPVVAAGGIADATGIRAALALGAAGVQMGTTFLLCTEASTTPVHRAALKSPAAGHTALTNLFSGRPARGIVNRLMRERGPISALVPAFPLAAGAVAPLRAAAEALGCGDFSPLWAGQDSSGCREIPAGDLVRQLAAGLRG